MLVDLVTALSRAGHPEDVIRTFGHAMLDLFGPGAYVSLSSRELKPGEYRITRLVLDGDRMQLAQIDPWSQAASIPVHTGGLLGEIIRTAYPQILHHVDLRGDPVVGDALGKYRSVMAIPLFDDGEPLNWAIFMREEPEGFNLAELEDSILRSNLVGRTVKNTLVSDRLREAQRQIDAELDRIARIQRALLPERMPQIAGVRLAAHYEMFDRAGGDYYDFLPMRFGEDASSPDPTGPWGIMIADASGHGPSAAVVMAMVHAIMHAYPAIPLRPAEVLAHLNKHLCAKRVESSFVTAFFAVYDPPTRMLRYACAGHNAPLLKDAGEGKPVRRLDDVGSVPLGIVPEMRYEEASIQLQRGQTVVFYTDGITESLDPQERMFGTAGIEAALTACSGEPDCVMTSITTALREHERGRRPTDDQMIVAMKVDG
jgi:sigma-B regulation protein RsbU (phosphoserine phosphatase)